MLVGIHELITFLLIIFVLFQKSPLVPNSHNVMMRDETKETYLEGIWRNRSSEHFKSRFVTQYFSCGRRRDLRDAKKPQKIGYLQIRHLFSENMLQLRNGSAFT